MSSDNPKRGKAGVIITIFLIIAALGSGGFYLYRMLNSVDFKIKNVQSLFDKRQYEKIAKICDDAQSSFSSLSQENKKDIVGIYGQLVKESHNEDYKEQMTSFIKRLYDQDEDPVMVYLDNNFPDEVNHIRITEAFDLYTQGKIGSAKTLCKTVNKFADILSFPDKCDLASLLCAIGTVEGDASSKKEGIQLYKQTIAFNEAEAAKRYRDNGKKMNIDIGQIAEKMDCAEQAPKADPAPKGITRSIVVTERDVLLRKGPGQYYDPITDYRGKKLHPEKGQRLEFLGETDEYFRVKFRSYECWISKQYSVASTESVK